MIEAEFKSNKIYEALETTDDRFIVLWGGAGSGKSYDTAQRVVRSCLENKGLNWCCIRKFASTLRHSVYMEVVSLINEKNLTSFFKINKSDMSIECIPTGSKVIMLGVDDPEKLKSISRIHRFWIEEASQLTEADFKQLNLRLRGKSEYKYQIFLTFNPISSKHWLKKYFFDSIRDNCFKLKSTYLDNKFLDQDYINELENLKDIDPYFYDVYALGEWGNLSGAIYTNWSVVNTVPSADKVTETVYGLDFGFNVPTALVKVSCYDGEYWIEELLYRSSLTNQDLIQELKRLNIKGRIYCDAAEPQRIDELCKAGFKATKADKSVMPGILFLMEQKLHITENSLNVLKEIDMYSWKADKEGNSLDEGPVKFLDHAMDAMRYAIYSHFKKRVITRRISMTSVNQSDSDNDIPVNNEPSPIDQLRMRYRMRL